VELSIIIVNYNSGDLLKKCVDSIFRWIKYLDYEVIVVDNHSTDNSMAFIKETRVSNIRTIINSSNHGFSKANNIGIKQASGNVILLLNPDTILTSDVIGPMYKHIMDDISIGVLGSRLIFPDGSLQTSAYAYTSLGKTILQLLAVPLRPLSAFFSRIKFFRHISVLKPYLLRYSSDKSLLEADFVTGACMMFRKSVIDTVGLMDESFFMYYEDEDLCRRIKMEGLKIIQDPEISIVHDFGWGKRGANIFLIRERYKSLLYYCNKYYGNRPIYNAVFIALNTFIFWISILFARMRLIYNKKAQ
jgi:GT2 family glycosyltransferase